MVGMIYQDGPGWGQINAGGGTYEVGMAFHVTAAMTVAGLEWYRYTTGNGIAPEIVRLWRVSDASELGRLNPVPDDGTVNWQAGNLATGVDLVTGETYIVSAYFPGANGQPSRTPGATPAPGPTSPVVLEGNFRRYKASPAGFPASADAGSYIGVDVLASAVTGGGGGGGGVTDADLAAWLSTVSGVQQHSADGLPWLIETEIAATRILAQGAKDAVTNIPAGGVNLQTFLAAMSPAILSAMGVFFAGSNSRLTGPNAQGGSAFYTSSGTLTSDVIVANQDTLAFMRRPLDDFPTGYTLADERDYDGDVIWTQDADLYVHQITSWPATADQAQLGARTRLAYAGWWAPQVLSLPQARRFLEFDQQLLEWLPRRMKGVMLHLKRGYSGHIQAYTHV